MSAFTAAQTLSAYCRSLSCLLPYADACKIHVHHVHYFVLHANPIGCLANVMAQRVIEPHALTHSMLSALMTSIASHANTVRLREAAKSLSAEGCGVASTLYLSHILYHADHAYCCIITCMQSQLHQAQMAMPDPLHVKQSRASSSHAIYDTCTRCARDRGMSPDEEWAVTVPM